MTEELCKFINLRKLKLFLMLEEPFGVCDIEKKVTNESYLYIKLSISGFLNCGLIQKKSKEGRRIYYVFTEKGKIIKEELSKINALLEIEENKGSKFEI